MKTVWLMGGLGNVLFQLFMKRLLEERGHRVGLCDRLVRPGVLPRLLGWTIHERCYLRVISEADLVVAPAWPAFLAKVARRTGLAREVAAFVEDPFAALADPPAHLFGYFQSRPFLSAHRVQLAEFGRALLAKIGRAEEPVPVAVHFRLGDSHWARSARAYYVEVKARLAAHGAAVVLTDSPAEARAFFDFGAEGPRVAIRPPGDPMEDFRVMANAETLYCGPSTFSWWAAHCVGAARSKVVVPRLVEQKLGIHLEAAAVEIV